MRVSVASISLVAVGAQAVKLSSTVQGMFDGHMGNMDQIFDTTAGYLYNFYYPLAAGPHETRSTVWYAAGLLQRNKGNDVKNAVRIINSVIDGQFKNKEDQWYGDYQKYPEEPTVGTAAYATSVRITKPELRH